MPPFLVILFVITYFAVGWAFALWFINEFLEDRRWSDGVRVTVTHALVIHLMWPVMAFTMGGSWLLSELMLRVRKAFIKSRGKNLLAMIYGLDNNDRAMRPPL